MRKGVLTHGLKLGIEFWAALYIPIVVAMAATHNVVAAIGGGPVALDCRSAGRCRGSRLGGDGLAHPHEPAVRRPSQSRTGGLVASSVISRRGRGRRTALTPSPPPSGE